MTVLAHSITFNFRLKLNDRAFIILKIMVKNWIFAMLIMVIFIDRFASFSAEQDSEHSLVIHPYSAVSLLNLSSIFGGTPKFFSKKIRKFLGTACGECKNSIPIYPTETAYSPFVIRRDPYRRSMYMIDGATRNGVTIWISSLSAVSPYAATDRNLEALFGHRRYRNIP